MRGLESVWRLNLNLLLLSVRISRLFEFLSKRANCSLANRLS